MKPKGTLTLKSVFQKDGKKFVEMKDESGRSFSKELKNVFDANLYKSFEKKRYQRVK